MLANSFFTSFHLPIQKIPTENVTGYRMNAAVQRLARCVYVLTLVHLPKMQPTFGWPNWNRNTQIAILYLHIGCYLGIHAHFLCLPFFFARSLLFLSLSPPLIFSPLRDICHLPFVRGSLVVLFSLHVHFGVVCSHWKNLLGGDKPKPLCYTTL